MASIRHHRPQAPMLIPSTLTLLYPECPEKERATHAWPPG